jgi:hypothetical protein
VTGEFFLKRQCGRDHYSGEKDNRQAGAQAGRLFVRANFISSSSFTPPPKRGLDHGSGRATDAAIHPLPFLKTKVGSGLRERSEPPITPFRQRLGIRIRAIRRCKIVKA